VRRHIFHLPDLTLHDKLINTLSTNKSKYPLSYLAILDYLMYDVLLSGSMETKVVKLDPTKIDSVKIREAAEIIDSGGLVAFPTETVYGIACRAETASLAKLDYLKSRGADKHYTLHIGHKKFAKKYLPTIGLKAQKLISKAWPGPLTIIFELNEQDLKQQLTQLKREAFEILYKDNAIGIRCPDNPIASMLLQKAKSPVVAPSANITGKTPSINAEQVIARFSGKINLLLDGGPCKYKKSSTIVKISKNRLKILRPGAYLQSKLEELSMVNFLFVCTGNTCRSPMALGIFRKYLAKKLKCKVDELKKMGYKTESAGTMGIKDSPASVEAIKSCSARGVNIKAHKSQDLSQQLIEESDLIYVMGKAHLERIINLNPASAKKCMLLAENKEIPDPIGRSEEFYNNCAELIEQAVKKRVSELEL